MYNCETFREAPFQPKRLAWSDRNRQVPVKKLIGYYSQQKAQKEWMTCSPVAYDMRDQLLHAFRFAFREELVLLSRVAVIAH